MAKVYTAFPKLMLSPEVQGIAFTFLDVSVTPRGFRRVGDAVFDGRITLERNAGALRDSGGLMAYVGENRQASLIYGSESVLDSAEGRGLAVHEACHAQFDRKGKKVLGLTSEGAASVAQLWYLMNAGHDVSKSTGAVRDAVEAVRGRSGLRLHPPHVPRDIAEAVRQEMAGLRYLDRIYAYDGF